MDQKRPTITGDEERAAEKPLKPVVQKPRGFRDQQNSAPPSGTATLPHRRPRPIHPASLYPEKKRRCSFCRVSDMDNINGLPDDLLVKILSFAPTKVAVSTCVLSKRWQFLWMWLPRLEFITEYGNYHYLKPGLGDFINKKLQLHKAPVIESLLLKLYQNSHIKPEDIKRWIDVAVSRYVRELEIDYFPQFENLHPSSLFTCKSLIILKLKYGFLGDVSSMVFLPSLKVLQLEDVKLVDGKSLQQLLSGCPILEDLSVQFFPDDNLREFTIIVPSLQSLSLFIRYGWILDGYEIDTPSLKYLKLEDWNYQEHYSLIKNMPKLRESYVDVKFRDLKSLIGSITSVRRLTICFYKDLSNLLGRLLRVSPHLRVLEISSNFFNEHNNTDCWNQPTSVPECLLSSLQIFKWSRYSGRQDRDIAVYILKNACHLKKATILIDTRIVSRLQMIKELTLSPPASATCQLVFDLPCEVALAESVDRVLEPQDYLHFTRFSLGFVETDI